jgi:hypothetical protein
MLLGSSSSVTPSPSPTLRHAAVFSDCTVGAQVLDSPFSRLVDLILEIVAAKALIPEVVTKVALGRIRQSVMKHAAFDICAVAPLDLVGSSSFSTPALFGATQLPVRCTLTGH